MRVYKLSVCSSYGRFRPGPVYSFLPDDSDTALNFISTRVTRVEEL